jgi:hypothetical protein
MNKITVALSASLFLLSAAQVFSQETLRADDILRWFPYGDYSDIKHKDFLRLAKGEAYPLYEEFLDNPDMETEINILPETLRKEIDSYTTAKLLKLKKRKLPAEIIPPDVKDSGGRPVELRSITFMSNEGEELAVYRYTALDLLVEEAFKKGEIITTDYTYEGRPIFSFRSAEDREKEYFAYAEATGELAVASDLQLLLAMAASGTGQDLNILDDETYIDIIDLIPDLGQVWRIHHMRSVFAHISEKMAADGTGEEKLDARDEALERAPQLNIEHWTVEEQIVQREITAYADEESAEKAMSAQQRRIFFGEAPGEVKDHLDNLEISSKTTLEGNLIVKTIIYDEKLLRSAQAYNKAMNDIRQKSDGSGKKQQVIIIAK